MLSVRRISFQIFETIPAVYDDWSVACLLLYPGDAFHHIKKPDSVERNRTLCPVREVKMVKAAHFTALLVKKIQS